MALLKSDLKERIIMRLDLWAIPRHRYQVTEVRDKVMVRLLSKVGVDEVEFSTTAGIKTTNQKMVELDAIIRAGHLRQQTDIEDFTVAE